MLKNDIKFLGVGGSRKDGIGTTCVQVSDHIVIDAGNIINGLGEDAYKIEHIFLTHSHLDHIVDIAFLVDNYYLSLKKPLKIYALEETIEVLKAHFFNDAIWPNFAQITLPNSDIPTVEFICLELYKSYEFEDVTLKPIPVSHTVPTCAYVIEKSNFSTLFATDTYVTRSMWEILDLDDRISSIIVDVSFPSRFEKLSYASKHLTPKLLKEEIEKSQRDIDIYITHIKPVFKEEIERELKAYGLLEGNNRVLKDGEYFLYTHKNVDKNVSVMQISTALSQEKDLSRILEMILKEAISYTNSEGGTIYLKEGDSLMFKSLINKKLNIYISNPDFPVVPLIRDGEENSENVSAMVALTKKSVSIPNIYLYNIDGFSFDGVKKFDKENAYKTTSMLVIPMINEDDEVVGVVQLINKKSQESYIPYDKEDKEMSTTYANWAATAISKNKLVEDLEALLLSFLQSISVALSAKSPYGYGHISRVAELMKLFSQKIDEDQGIFKDIHYSKEALKEMEVAAWMHDIGKIATPDYILDKATKLESLNDRITLIKTRFLYVLSALKAQMLEEVLLAGKKQNLKKRKEEFGILEASLLDDLHFIQEMNLPQEALSSDAITRLHKIAKKSYIVDGEKVYLLEKDELENLTIVKGSLNEKERMLVNKHAQISNDMLDMLTFPKTFSRVNEIASAHHEKINGKGYPRGLKGKEISFEARLMAVVDIFEALTASDRPYKKANNIEKTFEILDKMVLDGELDADIIQFLKQSKAYAPYATKYLKPTESDCLIDA